MSQGDVNRERLGRWVREFGSPDNVTLLRSGSGQAVQIVLLNSMVLDGPALDEVAYAR